MSQRSVLKLFLAIATVLACLARDASAINGQQALNLTTENGWRSLELLSQGNSLTGISDFGYGSIMSRTKNDGLGLYRDGQDVSVWINHETGTAAVSRVDLNLHETQAAIDAVINGASGSGFTPVQGVGYAYNLIYGGSYHAITSPSPVAVGAASVGAYGDANFDRFCSGTSHEPEAFGPGTGFVDSIYITGEEVAGGYFYALDEAKRAFWQAPDLGLGRWENAAMVDTGETDHVALVLNSDNGTSPGDYLQLYVGKKGIDANSDGTIDFLERNGLRGGDVYYFDPTTGSITDLPDGTVSGLWSTSTAGALQETKLEDVHTNPNNGKQLVFADQTDGVYRMNVDLTFTAQEGLDLANSPVTIFQIDDDDTGGVGAPDNLTWSRDGNVYVQEDGAGDEIYQMSPTGSDLVRLAIAESEPSGVIDASERFGYYPGSVLLTSLQGNNSQDAQLGALISPDAARLSPGDYDLNGVVDEADYDYWSAQVGVTTFSTADGNGDGAVDSADYTIWRDHYVPPAQPVPEPGSLVLIGLAVLARGLSKVDRPK